MLDAILRRGQTLESAAAKVRGLSEADRGLAIAIAGETLRRLPDFDALIDSVTRQRLPDDSKARLVLRMALARRSGWERRIMRSLRRRSLWWTADRAGWCMACSVVCCARG